VWLASHSSLTSNSLVPWKHWASGSDFHAVAFAVIGEVYSIR
jgi:hypothetical protein